jgi:hypothetical protein
MLADLLLQQYLHTQVPRREWHDTPALGAVSIIGTRPETHVRSESAAIGWRAICLLAEAAHLADSFVWSTFFAKDKVKPFIMVAVGTVQDFTILFTLPVAFPLFGCEQWYVCQWLHGSPPPCGKPNTLKQTTS